MINQNEYKMKHSSRIHKCYNIMYATVKYKNDGVNPSHYKDTISKGSLMRLNN